MSSFSEAVTQAWYQNKKWIWLFLPLSLLFWLVSKLRRAGYLRGWFSRTKVDAPVIIVGNISVGGTGKSPLTGYLVSELIDRGYRPGVISRGYGGKSERYPLLVNSYSEASQVGDEPLMLYQMTQSPVVVDPIRSRGAKTLIEGSGCNVILCDDGLQHYALERDIEICVIDGKRGLGNGLLLPSGPLREPASRLSQVDFIIVNGDKECLDEDNLKGVKASSGVDSNMYNMTLDPLELVNLFDGRILSLDLLKGVEIHAVAGIGNPERFFLALQALGAHVNPHSYSDHHDFTQADFNFERKLPVVMTHKDAVKCLSLYNETTPDNFWYLPVRADINPLFIDQLCEQLANAS